MKSTDSNGSAQKKSTLAKKPDPIEPMAITVQGRAGWAVVTQDKPILINLREYDAFTTARTGTSPALSLIGRLRLNAGTQGTESVVLATNITQAEGDAAVRALYTAAISA